MPGAGNRLTVSPGRDTLDALERGRQGTVIPESAARGNHIERIVRLLHLTLGVRDTIRQKPGAKRLTKVGVELLGDVSR